MEQNELDYWQTVIAASAHRWIEDSITSLNNHGSLYYIGGESGNYMRLYPNGKMCIGTYEDAFPHIGDAIFEVKATHQYASMDEAFQAACQLGGKQFLKDIHTAFQAASTKHGPDFEIKI